MRHGFLRRVESCTKYGHELAIGIEQLVQSILWE